jgi:hypothetical protein
VILPGKQAPGPEASMLNFAAPVNLSELQMEVLGARALVYRDSGGEGGAGSLDLSQPAQAEHLRRIERSPAQHHRQMILGL